mgnify:CR=1 FL=1
MPTKTDWKLLFWRQRGASTINGIVEFNDHELLLFPTKKTVTVHTETSQFSCKMPESSLESLSPTVVARQGDYIYIGSNNKVYTYSLAANTLSSFVLSDNLKDKNITAILQQSPTRIWIAPKEADFFYTIRKQGQSKITVIRPKRLIASAPIMYVHLHSTPSTGCG